MEVGKESMLAKTWQTYSRRARNTSKVTTMTEVTECQACHARLSTQKASANTLVFEHTAVKVHREVSGGTGCTEHGKYNTHTHAHTKTLVDSCQLAAKQV